MIMQLDEPLSLAGDLRCMLMRQFSGRLSVPCRILLDGLICRRSRESDWIWFREHLRWWWALRSGWKIN